MKHFARIVFFVVVALPALTTAQPRHLRVVWTTNPETQATISFTSDRPGASVQIGPSSVGPAGAYARTLQSPSMSTYRGSDAFFHHVAVDSLQPSTTYYFQVEADGQKSREYHFRTAPIDDRPFKIIYGGDSRTNIKGRQAVNKLIKEVTEQNPSVIAFAHGGDYISIGEIWSQWDQWLDDHQLTFTDSGRVLPIIPARGNHELDGYIYNQVFGFPGGIETDYWVTKIGTDLTWITLDTNSSLGGNQSTFLENTLSAAQKSRWIVANYHRPAFPAVKSVGPAYQHFVPLFEKYDVDFVCESDGHVLKRTVPIRNGMMDPTGVVYIGEGGLGVNQRTPDTSRWYLKPPGMAASAHHIQLLSFDRESVGYRAIGLDRRDWDTYTFKPKRRGTYAPPELASSDLHDNQEISIQFSESMNPTSFSEGSVTALSDHKILSQQYDPNSNALRISLSEPVTGTVRIRLSGPTDLAGQQIDHYVLEFDASGESPATGTVSDRKSIAREVIEPPKLQKAPAPIPSQPKQKGCATSEPRTFGFWLMLLALVTGTKKRRGIRGVSSNWGR